MMLCDLRRLHTLHVHSQFALDFLLLYFTFPLLSLQLAHNSIG